MSGSVPAILTRGHSLSLALTKGSPMPVKKDNLTTEHKDLRKHFPEFYVAEELDSWVSVIFSDEKTLQRIMGKLTTGKEMIKLNNNGEWALPKLVRNISCGLDNVRS